MGLILIVIAAIAGWNVGQIDWRTFVVIAVLAPIPAAITILSARAPSDPADWLVSWAVTFLYLAVPYAVFAFLKQKRIENRGD